MKVPGLERITDPGLRTALYGLGNAIAEKKAKKERRSKPFRLSPGGRQFGGHSEEDIQAARALAMRITGERDLPEHSISLVPAQAPAPEPYRKMVQLALPF